MKAFDPGDRIIYNGEYVGTLVARTDRDTNEHWTVKWDDGADTENTPYPAETMVYLNGGPTSGQRTQPVVYLTDAELYAKDGETALPDGTFVESSDGSVWWVEPEFGWDCVTPGSSTLSGPAKLLVMGRGFDE